MRRVSIAPANRLRRLVVMTDVSSDLPREISDRGKDASREQVPLDLGEPQFDLIQPRRIGRREVQPDIGVRDQERAHGLRLMRREVIDDHVDLAARWADW